MDGLEQVEALKDGRIDIGFDRILLEDPLITHTILREEAVIAALPVGHELLREPGPCRLNASPPCR
jgi:DNA-binding transcriptional LysR family regulator